jgi:hypothetical protein
MLGRDMLAVQSKEVVGSNFVGKVRNKCSEGGPIYHIAPGIEPALDKFFGKEALPSQFTDLINCLLVLQTQLCYLAAASICWLAAGSF